MNGVFFRKLTLAGAVGLTAVFSANASAVVFNFSNEGGFELGSEVINDDGGVTGGTLGFDNLQGGGAPANTYGQINWIEVAGQEQGAQSMLTLDTFSGQIEDDGVPVVISTLTHENNVIPAGFSYTVDTLVNFSLTDVANNPVGPFPLINDRDTITFLETINAVNPLTGLCDESGSNNLAGSTCDDLYSIATSDFESEIQFQLGKTLYTLVFEIVPGANAATETVGPNEIVYTSEDGISTIDIQMSLTSEFVPEPGSLALLSLGLVGFGVGAKRKLKKA